MSQKEYTGPLLDNRGAARYNERSTGDDPQKDQTMRFNPTDALNHNPDDDTGDDGDFLELIQQVDPADFEDQDEDYAVLAPREDQDEDYFDQMYLDQEAEREDPHDIPERAGRQRLY